MEKYIEKYWQHPKFYAIHLYLCFIFAFLGILVFGFSYFYASFDRIKETGFYLLCFYAFSFCACSTFFIVAASQQHEKDIQERKDLIKGCWMWLCGFLPIVAGMTLWILYVSSSYALDSRLLVNPSPELTRELEFLTGRTFEEGFFDYSLDKQTIDMDSLLTNTARGVFLATTHPRYKTNQRDIRNYKYEAVIKKKGKKERVKIDIELDSAMLVGLPSENPSDSSKPPQCFLVADFEPKLKNVVDVLGNDTNETFYEDDKVPAPTFFIKEDKLYIDTRDNGEAWINYCIEHFNKPNTASIANLPPMNEDTIRAMDSSEIYLLGLLLPNFHEDIHPIKTVKLRFSIKRFGRRV